MIMNIHGTPADESPVRVLGGPDGRLVRRDRNCRCRFDFDAVEHHQSLNMTAIGTTFHPANVLQDRTAEIVWVNEATQMQRAVEKSKT